MSGGGGGGRNNVIATTRAMHSVEYGEYMIVVS
jgi:hypothetical protein